MWSVLVSVAELEKPKRHVQTSYSWFIMNAADTSSKEQFVGEMC